MTNTDRPGFEIAVRQEKYLSTKRHTMNAIVTVTAHGLGAAAVPTSGPTAAEVIVLDTSGSMNAPPEKIRAARQAAEAAIAALRHGVHFAVVGGTHTATMLFPDEPRLVAATAESRAAAVRAVYGAKAVGGTAIGTWLALARQLLDGYSSVVRHVLMFTDGRNEHETSEHLDEVLAECRGTFVCDARGIGELWVPDELDRIVTVLNGQSDAVRRYADLADDFRRLMRSAMGRVVPDVSLRLRLMTGAELGFVKQVYPTIADLTPRRDAAGWDFYIGSWGDEQRDYHVSINVDSKDRPTDQDTVAARLDVVLGSADEAIALPDLPGLIRVRWTTDPVLFTRSHVTVDHYLGQEELDERIRKGCKALDAGDLDLAVVELGAAVRLATTTGNERQLERLVTLVDIVDAAEGKVALREDRQLIDILWAEGGSRFTKLGPDGMPVLEPVAMDPGTPIGTCACGEPIFPGDVFCENCTRRVDGVEQTL